MSTGKKEIIHPDITYLKDDQIGKVICKGLSVLVREKPKNPIDYLAKWLLNQAQKNMRKKNVIIWLILSLFCEYYIYYIYSLK